MKPLSTRLATRSLGRTGIQVSEIGFGGWGIGKGLWGRTDDAESHRALRAAVELGINFFDTAYAYGHGHSEKLIGMVARETGAAVTIATKVPPKNMEWPAHPRTLLAAAFPPDWIRSCAETSLRNLRRDHIDIIQFHVWTDSWLKDRAWIQTLEALHELRKEGKVRFIGVSINSHEPDTALEVVRSGSVDTVQVILNLFDQSPLEHLSPLCRDKGVGIIARCPFDEGGLTGMLTSDTRFEPEDFRSHYFGGDRLVETVRRAKALEELLVKGGHTRNLPEAALKFCLSFPEVSTVIPGMRKATHVEANVQAADGRYFDSSLLHKLKPHVWNRNFYN